MRTTFKILLFVSVALAGCGKPDADRTPETGTILPLEKRAQAAVEWNDFRKSSGDGIDAAQKNIEALRDKIYLVPAKDKVKIRRIINKNEYGLEKLRKELYDHDAWFEKHIGTFTDENAAKIEAFKTRLRKKMENINAEINDCNC